MTKKEEPDRGLKAAFERHPRRRLAEQPLSGFYQMPLEWVQSPGEDAEPGDAMTNSVRRLGIQIPIAVHQIAARQFKIVDGRRRWLSACLLSLKIIPVVVLPSHVHREDLLI